MLQTHVTEQTEVYTADKIQTTSWQYLVHMIFYTARKNILSNVRNY